MQDVVRRPLVMLAALLVAAVPLSAQAGTFSGDDGPIAYTCGANVCVVNPDGSNQHQLVADASDPSWTSGLLFSPSIAYVTAAGIVVADADGTNPGLLQTNTATAASQPSFSSNGSFVAFARGGDIFLVDADTTSSPTNLTGALGSTTDSDPAFGPGGATIAYVGDGQVRLINNVTFSPSTRPVTTTATAAHDLSWAPDGSTIAYVDGGKIFTVPVTQTSGAGTSTGVSGSFPAFSPDGKTIVFVDGAGHLARMSPNGTGVAELPGPISGTQPDWQAIAVVSTSPPTNIAYPTIRLPSGDSQPVVGHGLTAAVGSWEGQFPISYRFQWKRCEPRDATNGPCFEIAGATSSFYTPTSEDVGSRLRVAVTATNAQGSASQNSEVSGIVIALPPRNRATPLVLGGNTVDSPLSLSGGAWDGSTPIAFTYSWRRCNPQGDIDSCVPIPGATEPSYTPTVQDIGSSIRAFITGTNPAGSDVVFTNHTFPIVDKPHFAPSASTSPLVGGTAGIGRQLTANVGTYGGDAPIATTFTWQRCDATGEACHVVPKAKTIVYFPTAADVGYTLRIVVVATNAYGTTTVRSTPTEPIAALPPHVRGRHIVGTRRGEYLAGGGHDDTIEGRGGNDTLLGGAGDDRIDGGRGNDVVTGGSGADRLNGGAGSDTIYAADGERDVVDCGAGRDRVVADDVDRTIGCEVVAAAPGSAATQPNEPTPRR